MTHQPGDLVHSLISHLTTEVLGGPDTGPKPPTGERGLGAEPDAACVGENPPSDTLRILGGRSQKISLLFTFWERVTVNTDANLFQISTPASGKSCSCAIFSPVGCEFGKFPNDSDNGDGGGSREGGVVPSVSTRRPGTVDHITVANDFFLTAAGVLLAIKYNHYNNY